MRHFLRLHHATGLIKRGLLRSAIGTERSQAFGAAKLVDHGQRRCGFIPGT
jgi:hypothetical protein